MAKTSKRRASRKRSGTRPAAPAEKPRANLYDDLTRRTSPNWKKAASLGSSLGERRPSLPRASPTMPPPDAAIRA